MINKQDRLIFKAKDIDCDCWRQGFLTNYLVGNPKDKDLYITAEYEGEPEEYRDEEMYNFCIEKETLCQSTGVKDKNGNLIFEGDILKIRDKTEATVTYESGSYKLKGELLNLNLSDFKTEELELTGRNVHD